MARRKTYPGHIHKRGRSYRLRFCIDREYFTYSFEDVKRAEVEAFAREEHGRLKRERERLKVGLPGPVRFSGLVSRFEEEVLPTLAPNTQTSYPKSLRPLTAFFVGKLKDPKLHELHGPHFEQYMTWRRTHGPNGETRKTAVSNRTLEKDRAIAHRMFNKAMKWGLIDRTR